MTQILQVLASPLGQRILGIYFTSTTLSALLTYYSEEYLYNKYIMPYLRGTKKASYVKPNVQAQINQLKRRVNRNAAAKCYFRKTSDPSAPVGIGGNEVVITDDLIADSSFPLNISGDSFCNQWLKLSGLVDYSNTAFRVIVYRPVKAGNTYSLPTTKSELVRIPDPAAFYVYADFFINQKETTTDMGWKRYIPLRNMQTIYNRSSSTLEKGDIHIQFSWEKTNTAGPHTTGLQLCYTDK